MKETWAKAAANAANRTPDAFVDAVRSHNEVRVDCIYGYCPKRRPECDRCDKIKALLAALPTSEGEK